jgi:hypothetical protein
VRIRRADERTQVVDELAASSRRFAAIGWPSGMFSSRPDGVTVPSRG